MSKSGNTNNQSEKNTREKKLSEKIFGIYRDIEYKYDLPSKDIDSIFEYSDAATDINSEYMEVIQKTFYQNKELKLEVSQMKDKLTLDSYVNLIQYLLKNCMHTGMPDQ